MLHRDEMGSCVCCMNVNYHIMFVEWTVDDILDEI